MKRIAAQSGLVAATGHPTTRRTELLHDDEHDDSSTGINRSSGSDSPATTNGPSPPCSNVLELTPGPPNVTSPEGTGLDALYCFSNEASPADEASSVAESDPVIPPPVVQSQNHTQPKPFASAVAAAADTLWESEPTSAMALDLTTPWEQDFSLLDWMTLAFDFAHGLDSMPAPTSIFDDFPPPASASRLSGETERPLRQPPARSPDLTVCEKSGDVHLDQCEAAATTARRRPWPIPAVGEPQQAAQPTQPAQPRPAPRQGSGSTTTRQGSDRKGGLQKPHEWPDDWTPKKSDNIIVFPDTSQISADQLDVENFGHVEPLDGRTHDEMAALLVRTSSIPGHSFPPFRMRNLPSRAAFNCCVQLYFEYFHPVFPLLHKPTFSAARAPWRLVLATAAVGCRYSRVPALAQCAIAMQELLRRAVFDAVEVDNSHARELWYGQVVVLSHLGMTYSGNKRLLEIVEGYRNLGPTLCRRKWKQKRAAGLTAGAAAGWDDADALPPSVGERWREWIQVEAHTRLYYCSFVSATVLPLCPLPSRPLVEKSQPS